MFDTITQPYRTALRLSGSIVITMLFFLTYADSSFGALMTKTSYYNSSGELLDYDTYEYNASGLLTKRSYYGSSGKLGWSRTYEYNASGLMTKRSNYDSSGELDGYSIYEYDNASPPVDEYDNASPPVDVNVSFNQNSYNPGDKLQLLGNILTATTSFDLYAAIVMPDGVFFTFINANSAGVRFAFSNPNEIKPYMTNLTTTGILDIFDIITPSGIAGSYSGCIVATTPGSNAADVANWLDYDCKKITIN